MYKIIIDKPEFFEANIQIEGANSNAAQCRLILETADISLLFSGNIVGNKCQVNLPKLKKYIGESKTGSIRLEVIVEDTFFTPWEDKFEVSVSKSVVAEVYQHSNNKPSLKPTVTVKEARPVNEIIRMITNEIKLHNISIKNASRNSKKIKLINNSIMKKFNLTQRESVSYILQVLKS